MIKKWISGILLGRNKANNLEAPESASRQPDVPALPSARKRLLSQYYPKSNSVFFTRFPREVRDQIYIAAFGGRTLHLDLQWDQAILPDESCHLIHVHHTEHVGRNRNARLIWVWSSSVCHRHPMAEPWDDRCQSGSSRELCNHFYPGDNCLLGVMGWLLSCRQA